MSGHFTTGEKNAPEEYVRITAVVQKPLLVLASNSPRRRELLALGGWTFDVLPAEVDEQTRPGEAPAIYVLRLAGSKAQTCAKKASRDQLVLAADTAVVVDGDILGKPRNKAEAVEMLQCLRGRSHQVYTGLAALRVSEGRVLTDLCVTDVPMRNYSDDEVDRYVATGDPFDKAGAYAIQHPEFQPVEKLAGCYASVMGLPLCHLLRLLSPLDVFPLLDVPGGCQSTLHYHCPITSAVLNGDQVG